jgi:hypothetical protein
MQSMLASRDDCIVCSSGYATAKATRLAQPAASIAQPFPVIAKYSPTANVGTATSARATP